jgi:hypothetical protein
LTKRISPIGGTWRGGTELKREEKRGERRKEKKKRRDRNRRTEWHDSPRPNWKSWKEKKSDYERKDKEMKDDDGGEKKKKTSKEKDEKSKVKKEPKRACRHCGGWHYDNECDKADRDKKPKSYSTTAAHRLRNAANTDETSTDDETDPSSTYSSSSRESDEDHSSAFTADSYATYVIYSNGIRQSQLPPEPFCLPKIGNSKILELPNAISVGTGIAYLSGEPCPIKLWLSEHPSPNLPLINAVADSGGASLIQYDLVPRGYEIKSSPLSPEFKGIGDNFRTQVMGYVVLPVLLPNEAAMDGDTRSAKTLR